jgi:hypothetical protein
MTKRTAALTSMLVLALGITAFTGSALAGNGNDNGGGKPDAGNVPAVSASDSASQDHGNSADAPGQVKKSDTATIQSNGVDANANPSQSGVKPDSSTAHGNHNTSCTTGGGTGSSATCTSTGSNAATAQTAAHGDASKRYGSGTTAAQVANSHGAPAGTKLTGPGNSQPHKVTDCKHKHAVDVHAVKSYSSAACTTGSTTATTSTSSSSTTNVTATGNVGAASGPAGQQGGVLGATASAGHGNAAPQGGVLGAIASVGGGVLPFTGLPLWIFVVAALAVIALGLGLRHQTRVTA